MCTPEEIRHLETRIREEVEAQRQLIDASDFIPNVRLINLLRFIALMLGMTDDAKVAFLNFILCSTEGLEDLTIEELEDILKVLKGWAEAELEAAGSDGLDADTRQQLRDFLDAVNGALGSWNPNLPPQQAAAVLAGLKAALVTQFPKVLDLLKGLIPEELLDELKRNQLLRMTPSILKALFLRLLKRWLISKFGEQVGKSLSGWVKVGLDLVELGIYLTLLWNINDLAELIDQKLANLVAKLADCGWGWPNDYRYVWIRDQAPYSGARVILVPFIRCAKVVDGKFVWTEPCRLTFDDGNAFKVAVLTRDGELYDQEAQLWRIWFNLDRQSVDDADCAEDCEICYTYLQMTVIPPGGIPQIFNILIGVRRC